jgi:beta-lactam-binding protein with PASTA domain
MTSIASVDPKLDTTTVAAGQAAQLSFAVTNTSGRSLMLGARMLADPPAEEGWSTPIGDSEHQFGEGDFGQFDVEVRVPPDAAPGTYNLRLLVYQTDAPGEFFTESPSVSIVVPAPAEQPEPQPDDGGGFPIWIPIVVGVAVLLIGGGILAWVLLKEGTPVVPEVTGLKLDEAVAILQEAGFEMPETGGVTEEWTGEAEAGVVTKQQPDAGTEKTDDMQVTLTIEQLTVPVPSVLGMKIPAAKALLNEARLNLSEEIAYERSDEFPGGAIVTQTPAANQGAIPGQEVTVIVAQELIPVPDLKGKSFTEARIALETLGLSVGKRSYEKTGGAPDTVVRQEPAANEETNAAGKVNLWLVEKKIAVPYVKGKDVNEAKAIISKAGLTVALFPMNPPPASQRTSRFDKPMIQHAGKASGMRLDWCLTWGKNCGRPAADFFCKNKKYSRSVQFELDRDIGLSKLLKTGQICKDPKCDGFKFIICEKEISQSLNKVEGQRPNPNTKVYTGDEVTLLYYKAPVRFRPGSTSLIQPQVLKRIQAGNIRLRNVDGDVRSVAPPSE